MDNSQFDGVSEIIENFEQSIGLKEDEFDSSFIFEVFSDSKIAKGLYFVLTKYFYDIKGLEDSDLQSYQYRIKLFNLMEHSELTWASTRQQKQLLETLSQSEGITDFNLEEQLFSDYSENFKVIRKSQDKPSVDLTIKYYNTEILKFLFSKSFSISFKIHNYIAKGNFVKILIRNCRFLGLELDLEVKKENNSSELFISLIGPNELVGRNIKYSNNIYALFISNLEMFRKEIEELFLEIQYYENQKRILLPLSDFPIIIEDAQSEEVFDSAIEKLFFEQWTINFPQWTITREPLIIEENIVMIPDFMLSYRSKNFYFEIVGFWTERYLTKKIKKVSILKNNYPNMILLVDKTLDWPETPVPTFFYDKKIPVLEIGTFLRPYENIELDSLVENNDFQKFKILIEENLPEKKILVEKDIEEILRLVYPFEILRFIEEIFNRFKNSCSFIYFSKYNFICSTIFLFEMKKILVSSQVNSTLNFQKLKSQFSFIDEKILKVIIIHLGFDFKYKSLLEEELVFKRDKVIISEIV